MCEKGGAIIGSRKTSIQYINTLKAVDVRYSERL